MYWYLNFEQPNPPTLNNFEPPKFEQQGNPQLTPPPNFELRVYAMNKGCAPLQRFIFILCKTAFWKNTLASGFKYPISLLMWIFAILPKKTYCRYKVQTLHSGSYVGVKSRYVNKNVEKRREIGVFKPAARVHFNLIY